MNAQGTKGMMRSVVALAVGVLLGASNTFALNRYAVAPGDWSSTATWSATDGGTAGATAPVTADNVYIKSNMVTVSGSATCATFTVSTSASAKLQVQNGGTLKVTGATAISLGNITVDIGGTGTFAAANGTGGTITNNGTMSFSGTASSPGTGTTLTQGNNASLTFNGWGGGFTLSASAPGNTVRYNFSGGGNGPKATTYYNLVLSGNDNKNMSAGTIINGDLTVANTAGSGTSYSQIAENSTIGGNLIVSNAVGGTCTFTAGAYTLTVNGTTTIGPGGGTLTISSVTGTKTFTGAVTINSGGTITESAAAALVFGGSVTNNGTLTASTGVHTFSGTGKTLAGTFSIPNVTVTGTYTNTGTLGVSTALVLASGGSLDIVTGGSVNSPSITVASGSTLAIHSTSGVINDTAAVYLSGTMNLGSGVNETIGSLYFGATQQALDTWGSSTGSPTPAHVNNTYFTGSGILTVATGSSFARTLYWDGTSASWNTPANWSIVSGATTPDPLVVPDALADAVFNNTAANGAETITLDASQTAKSLTFNNTGTTTLTGGGTARTLTLGAGGITMDSGAGAVTLGDGTTAGNNVLLTLAAGQNWTNNSAANFTISDTAAAFTRSAGATLGFVGSGAFSMNTTVLPNVNNIVGPWAFFGTDTSMQYAYNNGGTIAGFTGGTPAADANAFTDATANYDFSTTATTTLSASRTANTIHYTSTGEIIDLSTTAVAQNLTLSGILATGASGNLTIRRTAGTGTVVIGAANELVVAGPQAVTITAPISNGASAGALTYRGTSILTLSGVNTYSGVTTVNSGTLSNTVAGGLGNSSSVAVSSGATLVMMATSGNTGFTNVTGAGTIYVNAADYGTDILAPCDFSQFTGVLNLKGSAHYGAYQFRDTTKLSAAMTIKILYNACLSSWLIPFPPSIVAYGGSGTTYDNYGQLRVDGITVSGSITLAGDNVSIGSAGGVGIISGVIGETGGSRDLTRVGNSTTTLTGANTYSGLTTVKWGVLALGNSLAIQNSALDANNSIAGGFSTTMTTLTFGGLSGSTNLATLLTTGYSGLTALTLNPQTGHTNTYTGVIANGAAGMTLTKTGAGTQILSGNNTYTGGTTVSNGTLVLNGAVTGTVTVVSGGTLGGTGTVAGVVTNAGTMLFTATDAIGGAGCLSATGTVTLLTGSTLAFDTASSNLLNSSTATYTFPLAAGGLIGTFTTPILPPNWRVSYTANSVVLTKSLPGTLIMFH